MQTLIYPSLIILIASSVQGATGFGFALIAVPLLSFFLPLKTLIPELVIFSLMINIMVVASAKKHIALKEIWPLILMGVVGIPIGAYGLSTLDPSTLQTFVGVIITLTSLAMLMGYQIKVKNRFASYSITGLISGTLNGSISMSGPPIVLFLTNEGYNKDRFRANINAYFVITNILTIVTFSLTGLLNASVIKSVSLNSVVIIIGTVLGITFSKRFNEAIFKKMILFLLIVTGIISIIKGL